MSDGPMSKEDVERHNDAFAREHDIDAYYADSGVVIRTIEERRIRAIERLLDVRPGERLLEVGCGGGHVLSRFPQAKLTGVDVSGEMLAKAARKLAHLDARLVKGELVDAGFAAGEFDAVICTEVLEHVIDPAALLREIRRVTRPNGRVVVTFPNDLLIDRLKRAVVAARLTKLPPFRRIGWAGHYHLHRWTVVEMRSLLEADFAITAERHVPSPILPIRCCFLCAPRPFL
ncbi:MAG: methyltransferase domain-containing protein [Polyangiaceae bacterium]|nr:methyltransferase domain-containing protein [Polyangiaceae bacterium]